ncbi:hypothetical protein V1477_012998 [Vespula maculifrons]|uniref:Uncharacterized protein n=1 Tax=Vespula maculifrons TaxID=7453 RepID=A0ABD2BUN6_VESMC
MDGSIKKPVKLDHISIAILDFVAAYSNRRIFNIYFQFLLDTIGNGFHGIFVESWLVIEGHSRTRVLGWHKIVFARMASLREREGHDLDLDFCESSLQDSVGLFVTTQSQASRSLLPFAFLDASITRW